MSDDSIPLFASHVNLIIDNESNATIECEKDLCFGLHEHLLKDQNISCSTPEKTIEGTERLASIYKFEITNQNARNIKSIVQLWLENLSSIKIDVQTSEDDEDITFNLIDKTIYKKI